MGDKHVGDQSLRCIGNPWKITFAAGGDFYCASTYETGKTRQYARYFESTFGRSFAALYRVVVETCLIVEVSLGTYQIRSRFA